MKVQVHHDQKAFLADLTNPIDLSIPLREGEPQVNCFYAPLFETSPVRAGDFVGSTLEGGPVNFKNVRLNPHGNGTHTECVGHIATEPFTINQCLKTFHFPALLLSIYPQRMDNGDRVITADQLREQLNRLHPPALIIRTLPNTDDKLQRTYSGTNPSYVEAAALAWLAEMGVEHLLIDLPSVDREEDGGALAAHKAWWQYPGGQIRTRATITELIYVPDNVKDGWYLLNLQIAAFELDASPSKPVIYKLQPA